MTPLNDDELNALLDEANHRTPEPGRDFAMRTLRAFQANAPKPRNWLLRPAAVPRLPGALAAGLLLLIGVVAGRNSVDSPTPRVETRDRIVYRDRFRDVYRDCEATQQVASGPIAGFTLKDFQPVRQINPRVIGSLQNDR